MVILVEWEVSVPIVRVVIDSVLSVTAFGLLIEMTLFMGALFVYFFKKFRKPDTGSNFILG